MKIIVCPNEEKIRILKKESSENSFSNIKYMTKKEFLNNYYFSYDDQAIQYLMDKYNYNIDVCKVYLNNLYVIDVDKEYKNDKLEFLKELKKELISNNLLIFNNNFRKYISNKEIEVKCYYDLDLYEEEALNYKLNIPDSKLNIPVYKFNSMEEEINFVCTKIIELLDSGIDINNIYLCNVTDDYFYIIKKLFGYYKIPITINFRDSIYGTRLVHNYLDTFDVDLNDTSILNKKLISTISSLCNLDKSKSSYKSILIDKLKNTYFPIKKYKNSIQIKDLYKESFTENDYVFILGFNQDVLPKVRKDIDYISDSIKEEVKMYDNDYLNSRDKKILIYLLSKIPNLFVSYKLTSPFASFYPSSLIKEFDLEVISDFEDKYKYSNIYNKIRLAENLDDFYLYGEENDALKLLNSNYSIPYNTYDNKFTGISNDLYLKNLAYPLRLSYTSLNTYNECGFKYYIKYVLKVDEYSDSFAAYIGSMYHKILSLYRKNNFDFETEYNKYLEKRELNLKERLLLVRIKKELAEFIDIIKKQELLTGYDQEFYEAEAKVNVESDVSVEFVGYIDKIMYRKNIEDTYFSIIDYKTGSIDTHIEPMKYGLHMQLPVYLYLIHYSRIFTNPIFTGIYYQNILFNYPSWSLKVDDEIKKRYMLNGYSTNKIDILEKFDSTYSNSEYIKSMKYSEDKGFDRYSKIIDDDTLFSLVKYTGEHIKEKTKEIVSGNFNINPKIYAGENVACKYCDYKDLCFMKETDTIVYPKVDDLSFLGGENNGMD